MIFFGTCTRSEAAKAPSASVGERKSRSQSFVYVEWKRTTASDKLNKKEERTKKKRKERGREEKKENNRKGRERNNAKARNKYVHLDTENTGMWKTEFFFDSSIRPPFPLTPRAPRAPPRLTPRLLRLPPSFSFQITELSHKYLKRPVGRHFLLHH